MMNDTSIIRKFSKFSILVFAFLLGVFSLFSTGALNLEAQEEPEFTPNGMIEDIPEDKNNIMIIGDHVFELNEANSGFDTNSVIEAFQTAYKNTETNQYEYYLYIRGEWQERVSKQTVDPADMGKMNGEGTYRFWNKQAVDFKADIGEFDLNNNITLTFNHETNFNGQPLDEYSTDAPKTFLKDLLVLDEQDEQFIDDHFNSDKIELNLKEDEISITLLDGLIDTSTFESFNFTYDELRFDLIVDQSKLTRFDGAALTNDIEDSKLLMKSDGTSVSSVFKNFEQWEQARIDRVSGLIEDLGNIDEIGVSDEDQITTARAEYDKLETSAADQSLISQDIVDILINAEAELAEVLDLEAVNVAGSEMEMKTALEADTLNLDFSVFDALRGDNRQSNVLGYMLLQQPFDSLSDVQANFEAEVGWQNAIDDFRYSAVDHAIDVQSFYDALLAMGEFQGEANQDAAYFEVKALLEDYLALDETKEAFVDQYIYDNAETLYSREAILYAMQDGIALADVNGAATNLEMKTALEADALNIDFTVFDALRGDNRQSNVLGYMLLQQPFDSPADVKANFEAEVAWQDAIDDFRYSAVDRAIDVQSFYDALLAMGEFQGETNQDEEYFEVKVLLEDYLALDETKEAFVEQYIYDNAETLYSREAILYAMQDGIPLAEINYVDTYEDYTDVLDQEKYLDRIETEGLAEYAVLRDVYETFKDQGAFESHEAFDATFDAAMNFRMATRDAVAYANTLASDDTLDYKLIVNDVIAALQDEALPYHANGYESQYVVEQLNLMKDEMALYPEAYLVDYLAEDSYTAYTQVLERIESFVDTHHVVEEGESIQTAIDGADALDTIIVKSGTHQSDTQIVVDKDLTITGESQTDTIIKPTQDTGSSGDARGWILVNEDVIFNLDSVTLDGESYAIYQAIRSKGGGMINNSTIKNIRYSQYQGIGIVAMGDAMDIEKNNFESIERIGVFVYGTGTSGSIVYDNFYEGKGDGDFLDYAVEVGGGASEVMVNKNMISNIGQSESGWTSAAILVSEAYGTPTTAEIRTNTIVNSHVGIVIGYNFDNTYADIAFNSFINVDMSVRNHSSNELIDLNNMMTTNEFKTFDVEEGMKVEETVIYRVNDTEQIASKAYVPLLNETQDIGYSSIQQAIDEAQQNDVIKVGAGTYEESLTIDKAITLKAVNGASETIIDGAIESVVDGVTVDGFTVDYIGLENADGVTIKNNIVTGQKATVSIGNTTGNTVGSVTIEENITSAPIGLYPTDGSSVTIINNTIDVDSELTTATEGIWIYGTNLNMNITGNAITSPDTDADITIHFKPALLNVETDDQLMYGALLRDNPNTTVEFKWSAFVTDQTSFEEALTTESYETIYVMNDIETDSKLNVNRAVTIEGNEHTLKAAGFTYSGNSDKHLLGIGADNVTISDLTADSNDLAYGMQAYVAQNVTLNTVTLQNSVGAGLTVNGSSVTADDLVTLGNVWGAVNVDPGSGVSEPSEFTLVSGTLNEETQIWTDGTYITDTATVSVSVPETFTSYRFSGVSGLYAYWSDGQVDLSNLAVIERANDTYDVYAYASIQAAIDAASEDETVLVTEGTYEESLTILTNDITLKATGSAENTIIDAQGAENAIEIGEYTKEGIHPTNVTIDGFTVRNYTGRGIGQRNGDGTVYIYNNIIEGPVSGARTGITISGGDGSEVIGNTISTSSFEQEEWDGTGILLMGSTNAIVRENTIDGADLGIAIGGYLDWSNLDEHWVEASGNLIESNTVTNNESGIAVDGNVLNTVLKNNTITDNTYGINGYESEYGGTPTGLTVENNDLTDNTYQFRDSTQQFDVEWIEANNTFSPVSYVYYDESANLIVERAMINVFNETQEIGYYNIQGAIDVANENDSIHISEGTYDGFLVQTDNLSLTADAGVHVTPDYDVSGWSSGYTAILLDEVEGITLDGFNVSGDNEDFGIYGYGSEATITNSTFENLVRGIFVNASSAEVKPSDFTITNNSFKNVSVGVGGTEYSAIDASNNTFDLQREDAEGFGIGEGATFTSIYDLLDSNTFILDKTNYAVVDYRVSPVERYVNIVRLEDDLQAAIDGAPDNVTMTVDPGTYGDSSVKLDIHKEGINLIAKETYASTLAYGYTEINNTGVTLEGFVIEARENQQSNALSTQVGVAIDNVTLKNLKVNGVIGLTLSNTADITIDNLEITALDETNDKLWMIGTNWSALSDQTVNGVSANDPKALAAELHASNTIGFAELHYDEILNIDANGNFLVFDDNSIQAADDAADAGDTIYVHEGTYQEDLIVSTDNLTIVAVGGQADTILQSDLFRISGNGVTLDGFTLDGNNTNQVVEINAENVSITNNHFVNSSNTGIQLDIAGGLAHNLFADNNIFDTPRGIVGSENTENITVTNNIFNSTETGVGLGTGVSIIEVSGNTFNTTRGLTLYEPTLDMSLIYDNTFNGPRYDGIYVKDATMSLDINTLFDSVNNNTFTPEGYVYYGEGKNMIVSKDAIDVFNETQETGHYSLQHAIDHADSGDTIDLQESLALSTQIDIDKDLTINGNGNTIDAGISIVSGASVTINDLILENVGDRVSGLSSNIENIIIGVRDGNLTLNNVDIVDSRNLNKVNLVGVGVQSISTLTMKDSTITLEDNDYSLVYGVYAQDGATVTLESNVFDLTSNRRAVMFGTQFEAINPNITLTNNTQADNANGDTYYFQVYSGSELDAPALHDYLDGYLPEGKSAYIYNNTGYYGWYEYPVVAFEVYNETQERLYSNIQNAVDMADANDTIIIDGDVQVDSVIRLSKDLTINGANSESTITSTGNVFEPQTGVTLTLDNLAFEGDGTGMAIDMASGLTVNATNLSINNYGTGIYVNPDADLDVSGSTFSNVDSAIGTDTAAVNLTVTNNTFESTTVEALGFTAGNDTEANFNTLKDYVVANNTGAEGKVNAYNDFLVAINTTTDEGHTTIQASLDAAGEDDTILVEPGTHEETLTIGTNGLTLRSRVAEEAVLEGGTLSIEADNVTIDGFTIDNLGGTYTAIAAKNSDGAYISNNIFRNSARGVMGDYYGTPSNLTVTNNVFEDTVKRGVSNTEDIVNLTVTDNTFDSTETGVGLGTGVSITEVSGNTFNSTRGLTLYEPTLDMNDIYDNTFNGARHDNIYIKDDTNSFDLETLTTRNTFTTDQYTYYQAAKKEIVSTLDVAEVINNTQKTGHYSLENAFTMTSAYDELVVNDVNLTLSETLIIDQEGITLRSATPQASTLNGEIQINADNVTIKDFILENTSSGRIISMRTSDGTTIDNNLFRNSERGIQGHLYDVTNLTVSNNTFETETGITSTHNILTMELTNNTFTTTTVGVRLQGDNQTTMTSIFENNSFTTDNNVAVNDERGTSTVTYDNEGYPE